VDEHQAALPLPPAGPPVEGRTAEVGTAASPRGSLPTWAAALQVLLVCGIPTQIVAGVVLALGARIPLVDANGISFQFIAMVSLIDTALVCLLIRVFLTLSGEDSTTVFVGRRPVGGEVLRGLASLPIVFLAVTGVVLALRTIAPWTHNVKVSPFDAYLRSPLEAGIFLVVVVLAGGVREELQRGFILHRFEQRLGGIRLGLGLFTILFGLLHLDQGFDVAAAVCLLGLFWGVLYVRRKSVVWAMTNHASFDAAQVLQAAIARSLGA
jgi:membrane protease YdiL (CAAX protease family)